MDALKRSISARLFARWKAAYKIMPWGDEWPMAAKTVATLKRMHGIDCTDDEHLPLFASDIPQEEIDEAHDDATWSFIEQMAKRRSTQ